MSTCFLFWSYPFSQKILHEANNSLITNDFFHPGKYRAHFHDFLIVSFSFSLYQWLFSDRSDWQRVQCCAGRHWEIFQHLQTFPQKSLECLWGLGIHLSCHHIFCSLQRDQVSGVQDLLRQRRPWGCEQVRQHWTGNWHSDSFLLLQSTGGEDERDGAEERPPVPHHLGRLQHHHHGWVRQGRHHSH